MNLGNSQSGVSFQFGGNVLTAGHDINVTVTSNDSESSMLIRLKTLLNPVTSATYNSYEARQRSECFPNTRVQVLNDIEAWIKGESHQTPIYILDGVAGIGNSTIAQTIAIKAAELGLLGATFFFSRDEEIRTVARCFFPTIAYQLSCYDNTFATHISHALEQIPDIPGRILAEQLSILLLKPLQELLLQRNTPILIVIDALDECEENNARELLTLFGHLIHQMKGLKILITSRPEEHIRDVLDPDRNHEKFCLQEIEDSIVQSDIQFYLQARLSEEEIRKASRNRRTIWQPTHKEMEILCGICGTLFVIAATAVKFILDSRFPSQKQLSRLLDGVSTSDFSGSKYNNTLDQTYVRILCAHLSAEYDEMDKEWLADLNRVLGAIITLTYPLPYQALASLLEMEPEYLETALSPMHSLVAPTGDGVDMTFRLHHKSFPDFITHRERIQQALKAWKPSTFSDLDSLLWVDVVEQHLQLAKACFKTMDRGLKQNMANIKEEDWYKDKEDIPQVKAGLVPRDLAYSVLHWASHLRAAQKLDEDLELRTYLNRWASRHILSWIETMVILGQVDAMYDILQSAMIGSKCTADNNWAEQRRVLELLSDACRFVQQGSEVMKISPMHVYRSCLLFVPTETSLYNTYGTMVTLVVGLGKSYQWNSLIATLIGHSESVNSVAFSSDGSRLASGSYDQTIRLWDANTGACISTLTDHSNWVNSVAFSSDGSRLASASNDETIRIWDANTGACISTLTDLSNWVNSVRFSNDGSRLASGSSDGAVRLWDADTGACIFTLTGHSNVVYSVAFSSDGSRVVSGSLDKTVRLWDTNTGANIATLTGHSDSVYSVAFLSNNSRVASASGDKTIRLWDADTCACISTLTGHSDAVFSVAFSCDGSRLASGSGDRTIRLWDANTGVCVSTLTGVHSESVVSVVFSSDGSRLASSGSGDQTIRVWNANTGACIPTATGHSNAVYSVAFSSDSSRVASGSEDETIRLWDANTDADISTLTGHSNVVYSVAFSSDGSRVASGARDGIIRLWDANTGACIFPLTTYPCSVKSVAFSTDGSRLASGSDDDSGTIRLWDANTGACISTLTGHSNATFSVAFSTNGSRLASGSYDRTVRLWDANTGACIFTLTGHSNAVNSVAFSGDGSRVVSASSDKTIRLWNANTGAHLSTLTLSPNSITSVLFLPNSSQVIDQVISPASRLLQSRLTDPVSLLLHVKRENPPIAGIMMASLVAEGADDFRWEVVPVCWFPPDIGVRCLSAGQLKSRLAIGCDDGRVLTLDFLFHRSDRS